MDRKIRYFVNGWSFRLSFATRPGYDGDHEDISDGDSYELGEYENSEEALAAAEAFISTHGNEVNDEEDGIGSVIGYEWTGRAHGSLADALATLAVQRWLEQWLVAE